MLVRAFRTSLLVMASLMYWTRPDVELTEFQFGRDRERVDNLARIRIRVF
jgi:hypothetical protein